MTSQTSHLRTWLAGSATAVALGAAAVGMSIGGTASAATHLASHARPAAQVVRTSAKAPSYPVEALVQEFGSSTVPFCPAHSGNAPCDGNGAKGDYGTIDRVLSRFSNGGVGNYAPFTKALTGKWMAVVSGTGDGSQGPGCAGTTATSNPGEACTGPYALFGTGKAEGVENVFPKTGFTVTDDLYLSPSTVRPAGSLVDDDVEINLNTGKYGIDNVITACAEPTATKAMGFVINFGHSSAGPCTGTPVVTKNGWYRFVFVFSNVRGDAYLDEYVRSESTGKVIAISGRQPVGGGKTAEAISQWGGPGYFWLPTEDMAGLPLANFAVQLGTHPAGHAA